MTTLRNHTHCQVAQNADAQTKTCQTVWLSQRTERRQIIKHENTTRNIRKPGGAGNLNFCTFIQIRNGLISWSFEIPASA